MEYVHQFFQQVAKMQWSDYLDIIIVAYLLYKVLPLIRSTGAMRVFKAVIVIVVVAALTRTFKLHTLSFILNQFLQIGLIAVVVLFQPELRRMLDHLGSMKLKKFFSSEKTEPELGPIIQQTVQACEIMSREKVGALIVFSRENPLDEYYKTGTMLDAQISDQLLRNVFFKNSPLHDGATIICGGRAAAAGCVLPLSTNPKLSRDLGTRHHAAVGISEVSDAVVVVVSEETGTISVAVGGMLKRHLAAQTLERLLRHELAVDEEQQEESLAVRLRQKLQKKDKEDKK